MACRLGVLTMDTHSSRANTWTLEQHPAFDRFTNQPTTFAVRVTSPVRQAYPSSCILLMFRMYSFSHARQSPMSESFVIVVVNDECDI